MRGSGDTCWTVIRRAGDGDREARETFARLYEPVVRRYLGVRWRGNPLLGETDDAVQEVFVECYRAGGVLESADPEREGGFGAFLHGVIRNVALRIERRAARRRVKPPASTFHGDRFPNGERGLSSIFDRAWARALLDAAAERQARNARESGEAARRRVELLKLRLGEGLPIREIAASWDVPRAVLHREYAKARREFRAALEEVVAFHHSGDPTAVRRECERLLSVFR